MLVKPAIGFLTTDSDAQLITDTQTIVTSMTNNQAYATPSPALATVTTAMNDFSVALANAADGGVTLTAIKNAKRQALAGLMRHLASYVHITCNGNMAVLLSSGFPTQKQNRTPVGILPAPVPPVLQQGGRSGDLITSVTPIPNCGVYTWRLALASAPGNYLQTVQTTAANNTFSGLTPGQTYAVDACAFGAAGPGDWSDTSELMVL